MLGIDQKKDFLRFGDAVYIFSKTAIELKRREEADYPIEYYSISPILQGFLSAKGCVFPV